MKRWSNRREAWYAPEIIEGPREVYTLDEGYVGSLGNKLYFRPTRGSDGFALYSTAARAKQQATDANEQPLKIRIYAEIVAESYCAQT
jgi:hypothetical protein